MVKPRLPWDICVVCKGSRLLCGKPRCPILVKVASFMPVKKVTLKREFFGSSPPSFFVGHYGYPMVSAGPMVPPITGRNVEVFDKVEDWFGKSIDEILRYRSVLIRASVKVDVKGERGGGRILSEAREAAMSARPVDVEVSLERTPRFKVEFDSHSQPMGPMAPLREFKIAEEPLVPRQVDKAIYDEDLKAEEAIAYLYFEGIPVSYVSRLLSAALLGTGRGRRLVPTRWAITATDDVISRRIIAKVKLYPEIDKILVFRESYLDNHFLIVMVPHSWGFEQLEAWYPGTAWLMRDAAPVVVGDCEDHRGRKRYASNVAGAYYAARLAVAEYLARVRRQALTIVFREVRPGYIMPLGVWVIRETVRNALRRKPFVFETLSEALSFVKSNLKVEWKYWESKSKLLDVLLKQKTLKEFSAV